MFCANPMMPRSSSPPSRKLDGFMKGPLKIGFPLEREIRALEESTRALHLAAGFHAVADLWPISVQFAAQTLTTVPWKAGGKSRFELATGSVFEGPQLQLGPLQIARSQAPP